MAIIEAMLLSEAAEEMRKLISEYEDESHAVSISLEGDVYNTYKTTMERTTEKTQEIQRQLEALSEQAMLT